MPEPRLKQLFQQYTELHLIENQHLVDTSFHTFCGVVFPIKAYYGGTTLIPRVSIFPLQDSGTGKSQMGEGVFWLLRYLISGDKVAKCVTATDASLIGAPEHNKKKENSQSRLLFKKDYLYWDEGSILLKQTPFSELLQDIIQQALDPSRWIEKHMREGTVSGYTNTSIIAGSYLEEKIKYSVLRKGFFPRFIITYKKFNDEEKIKMMEGLGKLENPELFMKKKLLQSEIRKELIENYGFKYPVDIDERKVIRLSSQTSEEFTKKFVFYYKENIMHQYMDNRQTVLESFWARVRIHTLCIAMHNAYLNHRDELAEEDYNYAFDLVEKYHIQGIKNLLNDISDEKFTYRKISGKNQKEILLQYIGLLMQKHKGEINQSILIDYIKQIKENRDSKEQKLDVGINAVLNLIKEMEQEGLIEAKRDGVRKLLKIKHKQSEI